MDSFSIFTILLYAFNAFSINLTIFYGLNSDLSFAEEKRLSKTIFFENVFAYNKLRSIDPCNFSL